MVRLLLVGLGAGVTAALLFATVATGQAFSVGLFYLAPLPIVLAGIAWNHLAGAIAVASAALLLGIFLSGWHVITFAVGIAGPAYILSYLALLARPADESAAGDLEWYPAGRLILAGALIAGIAAALTVPALGTDAESYRAALKTAFERFLRAQSNTPADQPPSLPGVSDSEGALEILTYFIPPAAAVMSMITMLFNLWLAGRIALFSGRLARPWPDLRELRFPPRAPILFAAAVAGTFLPGILAVVAGFFTATFLMAYAILGLAIVHGASRAFPARIVLLTAVWLSIFLIGWPILLMALLGLADSFIDFRARFAGGPNLPDNRNPND